MIRGITLTHIQSVWNHSDPSISPLFCKPVIGQELFLLFVTTNFKIYRPENKEFLPDKRWCKRVFPFVSCVLRTSQPTSEQNFLTHILGSSFCWSSVGFEPVTKCETSRSAQLGAPRPVKLDLVFGVITEWFVVELLVSISECNAGESPMLLLQWWFLSSHPNQCSNRADTSTLTQHSSEK